MMLSRVLENLFDFLYPKSAEVYQLESLSASELVSLLPPAREINDNTIAIFAYQDPRVRSLIWELKYRKNEKIAGSLATVLYDVLGTELAERALFENFLNPLLIPMPTSDARRRERGWNQTEILCEEVKKLDSEHLFEYRPDILRKVRHTESQTLTKDKKKRLQNLEGTMEASDNASGRCVILLDDVTTTGATFAEAKRKLRLSGASKILCIALAH